LNQTDSYITSLTAVEAVLACWKPGVGNQFGVGATFRRPRL